VTSGRAISRNGTGRFVSSGTSGTAMFVRWKTMDLPRTTGRNAKIRMNGDGKKSIKKLIVK
jgi:hypothetical protein